MGCYSHLSHLLWVVTRTCHIYYGLLLALVTFTMGCYLHLSHLLWVVTRTCHVYCVLLLCHLSHLMWVVTFSLEYSLRVATNVPSKLCACTHAVSNVPSNFLKSVCA